MIGELDAGTSGNGAYPAGSDGGAGAGHLARGDARGGAAVTHLATESMAFASVIERAARDPHVNIDKFERLLAIKERIDAADAMKAFNAAVAAARGVIPPIVKNRVVDFTSQKGRTNYRHEDFAEVARTIDPHLAAHGLSYRFRSRQDSGKVRVTCVLSHIGGHAEETMLEAAEDHSGNKNNIQAIGSAVTYLQRYTLKLALGLAASEDDGGKAATATVTDGQVKELEALIAETRADKQWICERYEIPDLSYMTRPQFDEAKTGLMTRKRAQAGGR